MDNETRQGHHRDPSESGVFRGYLGPRATNLFLRAVHEVIVGNMPDEAAKAAFGGQDGSAGLSV